MRIIERRTRAEIHRLPEHLRQCALARVAIDLASRLDGEPTDTAAVLLARELRMTMTELHRLAPEGGTDDVERFLARIATPDVGNAAD